MKFKHFFEKYWFIFAIFGLGFIFFVMPLADLDLFSTYVGTEQGRIIDAVTCEKFEGTCYDNSKGIRMSISSKLKGNSLIDDCGIKDGICKCTDHLLEEGESCSKYSYEVDISGAEFQSSTIIDGISLATTDTDTVKLITCGADGKLYKDSELWNDCEGLGCWTKDGIGVCKEKPEGLAKLEGDVKGVPIWIIVLGVIFLLAMFALPRR